MRTAHVSRHWSRRLLWMFTLGVVCALGGCARRDYLKLHYLNEFVPGTRAIFLPAKLALAPVGGDLAAGIHEVGSVHDSAGNLEKSLLVSDAGAVVHDALMTALSDAGVKPIALESGIDPKDLQPGVDVMLSCDLLQLTVRKNFGAEQSVHGQYFTMNSLVKLKCTLQRRDGSILYENEVAGAEDEPPKPVGNEVFFPLETDPAESLSVALSRAIGALLLDPKFRTAFPPRA
jgi:hypothetical protein